MNNDLLLADLIRDEDLRLYAYDDETGLPLHPGYTLKGHPTIGIGRALDVHGITAQEATYLASNDIAGIVRALGARIPFWAKLNDSQQRALANIAFNAGVDGLMKFKDLLAALAANDSSRAAAAVTASQLSPRRISHLTALLQA